MSLLQLLSEAWVTVHTQTMTLPVANRRGIMPFPQCWCDGVDAGEIKCDLSCKDSQLLESCHLTIMFNFANENVASTINKQKTVKRHSRLISVMCPHKSMLTSRSSLILFIE